MVKFGKRKDGQAYPKNKKSKTQKKGSTKSSGIKLTPKYIPAKEEQPDQLKTRMMIISEYGKPKMSEIMMKPSDFLRATNNDRHWIPFDNVKSVKRLRNRMENNLPIDVPILVYDANPEDPHLPNSMKYGQIEEHEGRHRAFVAIKEHIPEILVDVYCIHHGILNHNCIMNREIINKATAQSPNDKQIDAGRDGALKEWERERIQHKKTIEGWMTDNKKLLEGRQKIVAIFVVKIDSLVFVINVVCYSIFWIK